MYGRHFVGRNHKNFYAREGKLGPIVFSHMIDSDVSCDPLIRMILRYDFYPFLIILAISAHFIFPLLSFTPLLSSSPHLLILISLTSPFPSSFSYPYSFLYSSSSHSQSYLPHFHRPSHTNAHSYTPPHSLTLSFCSKCLPSIHYFFFHTGPKMELYIKYILLLSSQESWSPKNI